MKKVDHLPVWLIRRLLRVEAKRLETPPAVLLLEDLTSFETGDQLQGCDPARAAVAMALAARLFHASFLNSREGFVQIARPHSSDRSMNLIARVRRDGLARVRTLHEGTPRCVLDGDYRLDNMFFRTDGSIRAVIDWQIPNLGRLRSDYSEALLVLLYRFAGLESMQFGDDRGPRLIAVWLRRLDARLARIPA